MNAFLLSLYVLVWPMISAILLIGLIAAAVHDYREARRTGEKVV